MIVTEGEYSMIRDVRTADAGELRDICETAMGYGASEETVLKRIEELGGDEHFFIRVYEEDGEVIGFIQAERYIVLYSGSGWNIVSLAVRPDCQNRGIGKMLLCALEEHAVNEGSDFVRLNSRIEREKAHGFYEHLGYVSDKTQKRFIKELK